MGLSFAAGWTVLGRDFTSQAIAGALSIAGAGFLAAIVALAFDARLGKRNRSARFAGAALVLIGGTGGFLSLALGARLAWSSHDLVDLPVHVAIEIFAVMVAGAAYTVLTVPGILMIPLGLPAIVLFSLLIAGRPR